MGRLALLDFGGACPDETANIFMFFQISQNLVFGEKSFENVNVHI